MSLLNNGILLAAEGDTLERLFDLDIQLLHDAALMIIAVFFLFLILSYLLFEPARKMMEARREKIAKELKNAADSEKAAADLKAEYEEKLSGIQKEAEEILADARKRASEAEMRTISEAREEASRITARAREEAELEKQKAADDVKREIVEVATLMAEKLLAANIDKARSEALLDETIASIGEKTWLNR